MWGLISFSALWLEADERCGFKPELRELTLSSKSQLSIKNDIRERLDIINCNVS